MSQTIKALMGLRELILSGEIPPGERLVEVSLVERLEVSRTPIRAALIKLAEEGLLEQISSGGYAVRKFTEHDIKDALEVRGVLEGTAARLAAERGANAHSLTRLKNCVERIDDLLETAQVTSSGISHYFDLNELFHRQLVVLSESFVVERMLERIVTLPFASPNAFVMARSEIDQSFKSFLIAQEQHRGIVEAIENREGMRAETLAREHARLALRNLKTVLNDKSALDQVPGSRLIDSSVA